MHDAVYCFPCRYFCIGTEQKEQAFTRVGFRDWKHATGKCGILLKHDLSVSHKMAMSGWNTYIINQEKVHVLL